MRASYTKCFEESNDNNKHVKTIANMRHVSHSNGAHAFKYLPGYTAVNSRKAAVEGPFSTPPAFDVISIYHYVTRCFLWLSQHPAWHTKPSLDACQQLAHSSSVPE